MGARSVVLFDLDGTLLEMHTHTFVKQYLTIIGQYIAQHYDQEMILSAIWDATQAMIMSDDGSKTNEQVFTEHFIRQTGIAKEEIWPLFDTFYRDVVPTLSHLAYPSPWAKKLIEATKQQGYRIAVATNPLFPREVIYSRIGWLDVSVDQFEHVTSYEESFYTKPHLAYYQEICEKLGVQPTDCIMVGNNMQEDMVAGQLGMKTFLVTNYLIDRGEPSYPVDQQGNYEELYQAISERTGVFSR